MPQFSIPKDTFERRGGGGVRLPQGNYQGNIGGFTLIEGGNVNSEGEPSWVGLNMTLSELTTKDGAEQIEAGGGTVELAGLSRRYTITVHSTNDTASQIGAQELAQVLVAVGARTPESLATEGLSWDAPSDVVEMLQDYEGARVGFYLKPKPRSRKGVVQKDDEGNVIVDDTVTSIYPIA